MQEGEHLRGAVFRLPKGDKQSLKLVGEKGEQMGHSPAFL